MYDRAINENCAFTSLCSMPTKPLHAPVVLFLRPYTCPSTFGINLTNEEAYLATADVIQLTLIPQLEVEFLGKISKSYCLCA